MTSSLATLVNNLSSLAKSAVDAAVQPGADPAPKIIDSVSEMSAEELKRYVPGSVLEMNDGSFGFTPLKRAVVVSSTGDVQVNYPVFVCQHFNVLTLTKDLRLGT